MFSLNRFRRSETGSLSIEAVLAVPFLIWLIVATLVFFDAFRTLNVAQKATYTVADMLSREEGAVDSDYITAMHEVFDYLSGAEGYNAIRVSVVAMENNPATGDDELVLKWSEGVNWECHDDIDDLAARIPTLGTGDQMIVVESVQGWVPAFGIGLGDYVFNEVALAKPRFVPQVNWQGASGCASV